MLAFSNQIFVPNNAALVVTGNISAAELRALAEKEFGAWPRGAPARAQLGAPATTAARLVLVDKAGAPQTRFCVALVRVPRSRPDYGALEVLHTLPRRVF